MNRPDVTPRPRVRIATSQLQGEAPRLVVDDPARLRKARKANRTSWKPQQSGNPNGRPRGAKGVKAITRKVLSEKVEVQPGKKMQLFEALLRQEAQSAAKGDWRARATMFALGKWLLGSEPDAPSAEAAAAAPDLSATGRAILELFADEVRQEERAKREEAERPAV